MSFLHDLPRPTKTYHSESYDRISPSTSQFDGKGKTVLITGGSEGIGLSAARSFAEAGIGKIIIASRSAGPQAEAKKALTAEFPNTEVQTIALSITDLTRVSEVMRSAGDIDVLVLNAAASHKLVPSAEVPSADFEHTFTANVIAPFHMVKEYLALPTPKSGSRTIINVSSAAAHVCVPGQVGYGPSKAAFVGVTQALAAEYTPEKDGVRFFSVHPGVFHTTLAKQAGVPDVAFEWENIKLPGDFAVWLAGPESTFLHGKFVWAQWDVDELIELKDKIVKDPGFLRMGLQM
jgi:NAD(P)-dependent dehydrogenase (short-subunit alcohol dehydrogenase family)